jgi:hypothetical protein
VRDGWEIPATIGIGLTLGATVVLARSPAQELEHRLVIEEDARIHAHDDIASSTERNL